MLSTIGRIDDPRLIEIFELWTETIDLRETEMMKNIEEYCRVNTFDRSAFLVGAAHRQPIIDRSRESKSVQWDFSVG